MDWWLHGYRDGQKFLAFSFWLSLFCFSFWFFFLSPPSLHGYLATHCKAA